jgi:demethylmenaquinone methyltransferase/2-methoxy-6-polyprenyl-1,4-benzoquinol methylase
MTHGSAPVGVRPGDEAAASEHIREMFGKVAPRYDLLNRLLSGRVDVYWRHVLVGSVREYLDKPDAQVLDLCCGTGDVIVALEKERDRRIGSERSATIGSDFSRPMLKAAHEKLERRGRAIRLIEADGLRFPAGDNSYDVITIAFGFRNFTNYRGGLDELLRLLKPGGCLAILECSQPPNRLWGPIFDWYFRNVLPKIGNAVSGAGEAYSYLQRSVERFFSPDELADEMKQAGFTTVRYQRLTGGISCLHLGYKRGESSRE